MIEITTLGNFSVKSDGQIITDKSGRTQRLWKLLNFLIVNRNKPSSIISITDFVWADRKCENPVKSLHNLIFRLRKLFASANCCEKQDEYIIFTQNGYMLNPDSDMRIDAYEMEDTYLKAIDAVTATADKIVLFNKIISLYNGKFLLNAYKENCMKMAADRYERIYTSTVVSLADLYFDAQQYDEAINICNKAIETETLEEKIYVLLIKSMYYNGQRIKAVEICDRFFERMYFDLGISASDEIKNLYEQLKNGAAHPPKNSNPFDELVALAKPLNNADIVTICDYIRKNYF